MKIIAKVNNNNNNSNTKINGQDRMLNKII